MAKATVIDGKQVHRRPTKLEQLSDAIAQDFAHANSVVVGSKRRILQFEAQETDRSIIALQSALVDMKERRAKLEAMIAGLSSVIAKR